MSEKPLAICHYCGQGWYSEQDPEKTNMDLLKKEAIMKCNCPEATQQRAKWELIDDTRSQLKAFFKQVSPETVLDAELVEEIYEVTEKFIAYLADGDVLSVSVDVAGIGKVTLTSKGSSIRIKKQTQASITRRY